MTIEMWIAVGLIGLVILSAIASKLAIFMEAFSHALNSVAMVAVIVVVLAFLTPIKGLTGSFNKGSFSMKSIEKPDSLLQRADTLTVDSTTVHICKQFHKAVENLTSCTKGD